MFLLILVVGPCGLGLWDLYNKNREKKKANAQELRDLKEEERILENEGGREVVTKFEYLLGLLGYAVGIGNVWRFPYLCGQNGGAAFLVAYFTCLFFVSMPAYMMELVMGQYVRKTCIHFFKAIHPCWQGLGWAQAFMLFWVLAYYNILLGYACIYIIGSLSDPFPWAPNLAKNELGGDTSDAYFNGDVKNVFSKAVGSASWDKGELAEWGNAGLGPVQWKVAISLLVVWIMVFFALGFGKKVLAKITWVTVLMPIALIVILFFRVVTLEGASEGVDFYIGKFDGHKLGELGVWRDACVQILFSLSPSMGTAITMSSYTKPHENVYQTCWIVALCNSGFSFFAGFAIFSIVGNINFRANLKRSSDFLFGTTTTTGTVVEPIDTILTRAKETVGDGNKALRDAATEAYATWKAFNSSFVTVDDEGKVKPTIKNSEVSKTADGNPRKEFDISTVYNNAVLSASVYQYLPVILSSLVALENANGTHLTIMAPHNFTEMSEALVSIPMKDSARSSSGLAFITIADGMRAFGGAQNVISVLFFVTLLTLGLDSTFAWAETWVSYIDDTVRLFRKEGVKKIYLVGAVCVIMYLSALPYCTRMGFELLDVVDNFVGLEFLMFGVFLEAIIFTFFFGFERFETALKTACGKQLGPIERVFWRFTLHFTMPLIPGFLFFYDTIKLIYEAVADKKFYVCEWMDVIGWVLLAICLLLIPFGAVLGLVDKTPRVSLDEVPGAQLAKMVLEHGSDIEVVKEVESVKVQPQEQAESPQKI